MRRRITAARTDVPKGSSARPFSLYGISSSHLDSIRKFRGNRAGPSKIREFRGNHAGPSIEGPADYLPPFT